MIKFLLFGPLPSIVQHLKKIGEYQMTLREELEKIDARLGTAVEGLRSDVDSLKAALANVAVPEDVSDVLSSLDHKVSLLEGLDNETPEPQPEPTEPPVEGDNV